MTPISLEDAALGCLLGACTGDAAGATLEFLGRVPTPADARRAMTMPGGGCFNVAPGQITDDSELALCLAHGLIAAPEFDPEQIARSYVWWYDSHPFDIGNTTVTAFSAPGRHSPASLEDQGGVAAVVASAARASMSSKANGSLMRATPLAVWGHRLPTDTLAACAMADSALSHPNPSCQQAVACYVLAAAALLNGHSPRAAFEVAETWARQHAGGELQGWLAEARDGVQVPYHPQIGFVRIGFTHAFRHLLAETPWEEAIAETLAGGGDTDTNAAIVGGLLGAAQGAEAIPAAMRHAVLTCDTSKGRPRPDHLHPGQVPGLVARLLDGAPAEINKTF